MFGRIDIDFPAAEELDLPEVTLEELSRGSGYTRNSIMRFLRDGRLHGVLRHERGGPPAGKWIFPGAAVLVLRFRRALLSRVQ